MKKILSKVAQRIKELRKINKLSQEQLAEKADVHPTYIGKIERAEMNPSVVFLEKISKAFNISLSELLSFPDDKKIKSASSELFDKATELLKTTLDMVQGYKSRK